MLLQEMGIGFSGGGCEASLSQRKERRSFFSFQSKECNKYVCILQRYSEA